MNPKMRGKETGLRENGIKRHQTLQTTRKGRDRSRERDRNGVGGERNGTVIERDRTRKRKGAQKSEGKGGTPGEWNIETLEVTHDE